MTKLIDGFFRFKKEVFPAKRQLYRELAGGQAPHSLFITCADSRVVPHLMMQSEPGDLFVCRTVGNQVPPHGSCLGEGVASSIEYAVQALGVENVIVCGHSDCGAMKAVLHPEKTAALPSTAAWLRHAATARSVVLDTYDGVDEDVALHLLAEENIVSQLEHVKTHPAVAARLARGRLQLHGWLYQIHSGEISAYSSQTGAFTPLGKDTANATPPRRMHGVAAALEGAA